MEPLTTTPTAPATPPITSASTPAPTTTSPPPPPPAAPAPGTGTAAPQPGTQVAGSHAGGQSPGAVQTPPAQPQPPDFEAQFRAKTGMGWEHAQALLAAGWRQMQGQQSPAAPAQTQPAPAAPQQANVFGLPAFDMNLLNFVGQDAQGRLVPLPGAPPDAVFRVEEYQKKLRDVQQNFWADPSKYLAPMIERQAAKIAQDMYARQQQQAQSQQFAGQVIEQNASWLFEADAQGQRQFQFNPATGRNEPVLSAYGRYYRDSVAAAAQRGVSDPQMQHDYAIQRLQNALWQQKAQQAQAGQQQQAANGQFVQAAAANPPVSPPAAPNLGIQPAGTLREMMSRAFNSNGLTDQALASQMASRGAA